MMMRFGWLAAAAAIVCAVPASAADIIQNGSASIGGGSPGESTHFSQFDPTLGNLKLVTISAAFRSESIGETYVRPSDPAVKATFTGILYAQPVLEFGNFSFTLDASNYVQSFDAPDGTFLDFMYTGSGTGTLGSDFDYFVGNGSIGAAETQPAADVRVTPNNATSAFFEYYDSGDFYNFQVDYNYEPFGAVPEPAAWLMLIAGFGVIGGALRHRRRGATHLVDFGTA